MSRSSLNPESTTNDEDVFDENTDSLNWQTSNSITELDNTASRPRENSKGSLTESAKEVTIAISMDSVDMGSVSKMFADDDMMTNESISKLSEFIAVPHSEDESIALQETKLQEKGRYHAIKARLFQPFVGEKTDVKLDLEKYFRVTSNAITILTPQEPWPKDVQLFQPYEVEQILLPDNANCLAVQTFLKMCELDYKVEARANADAMSPTGRVPFIKCGAFIVSELEGIVQFIGSKGISLTSDLDPESKADMRAYMTLVNNVLGNAELYLCWCDNETFNQVTKLRYGSVYPWPLNFIQTWTKRQEEMKRLKVIGWYQKSLEEVYNDVETCCQALTDRLDQNLYFFGINGYTELDALVYAHLYVILTTPMPNNFTSIIKNFPTLVLYCQKVDGDIHGRHSTFPTMLFEKTVRGRVIHDNKRTRLRQSHTHVLTAMADPILAEN